LKGFPEKTLGILDLSGMYKSGVLVEEINDEKKNNRYIKLIIFIGKQCPLLHFGDIID